MQRLLVPRNLEPIRCLGTLARPGARYMLSGTWGYNTTLGGEVRAVSYPCPCITVQSGTVVGSVHYAIVCCTDLQQ